MKPLPLPATRASLRGALLAFAAVLVALIAANTVRIYQAERDRLMMQGQSEIHDASGRLNDSLQRMSVVLDTLTMEVEDYLEREKPDHAAVEAFLSAKTRRLQTTLEPSYLEVYLGRKGWYASGIGWKPTEDYRPEDRPWFRAAMKAGGKVVILSPFYAVTQKRPIIAVCRLLRDGRTVLGLDADILQFGPMAQSEVGGQRGRAFFLSPDGCVLTNEDRAQVPHELVARILASRVHSFVHAGPAGEQVVFQEAVFGDWHAAVSLPRTRYLAPVWRAVFWQLAGASLLVLAGFLGLSVALRRSRRASEETAVANAASMERALQALHSRSSLGSYRTFLEIVRARFDGEFCYMSRFNVKERLSRIEPGDLIFRSGDVNDRTWTLEMASFELQLGDIAQNGFCVVDAEDCRRIFGARIDEVLPASARKFRTLVSVPLIVSGRLWGALSVGFARARGLDPAERDNLSRVADVLASAIERRGTYEEVVRTNGELKVALAAAEQGERAKATFLATMSHEIRTPLNAVIGFAEFLRAPTCTEAERREYTDGILTSSQALLSLINDILDLSKIDAGRMDIRGGACDLAKLFREMREIFRFRVEKKGLSLKADLPAGFPVLELQEERVRQILLNLVGNAVKFTAQGGVSLSAALPDGDLEIRVADTGRGISPEQQEAIFNPFEQNGGVRGGQVYQGTGLGLSICRRLVESVGGAVSVSSEVGKGSVFTVRIPKVGRAAAPEPVPPAHESGRLSASLAAAVRRRVYLVDDVALNLRVAARHVQRTGIAQEDIRTFSRARDALAALQAAAAVDELPIAVLTDMWMPEMDGAELARAVRGVPALEKVPVVALTADADSAKSFDLSLFDAVLTKPLTGAKIRGLFKNLG